MHELTVKVGYILIVAIPVAFIVAHVGTRLILRLAAEAGRAAFHTGDYRRALSACRWLRRIAPWYSAAFAPPVEGAAYCGLGDPERAIEGLALSDPAKLILHSNAAVDILVSMGRYSEALAILPQVLERLRGRPSPLAEICTLLEINAAEAEYNEGHWAEAEQRMLRPEAHLDTSPICRAGSRQQLAWILAHRGESARALALCDETHVEDLPGVYHAEFHYCRAAALIAGQRLDEAEQVIRTGWSLAKRPSSSRNALYLLARVAALRQDWPGVETLCRTGAEHRWRYQGGDGLLLWGDALERLGRATEAFVAWRLAVERDPQSEAAGEARTRLASACSQPDVAKDAPVEHSRAERPG